MSTPDKKVDGPGAQAAASAIKSEDSDKIEVPSDAKLFGRFGRQDFYKPTCSLSKDEVLQNLCVFLKRAVLNTEKARCATEGTLFRVLCAAEIKGILTLNSGAVTVEDEEGILQLWQEALEQNMVDWGQAQLDHQILSVKEIKYDGRGSRSKDTRIPYLRCNMYEMGVSLMTPGGSNLMKATQLQRAAESVAVEELLALGLLVDEKGVVTMGALPEDVTQMKLRTGLVDTPKYRLPTSPGAHAMVVQQTDSDNWVTLSNAIAEEAKSPGTLVVTDGAGRIADSARKRTLPRTPPPGGSMQRLAGTQASGGRKKSPQVVRPKTGPGLIKSHQDDLHQQLSHTAAAGQWNRTEDSFRLPVLRSSTDPRKHVDTKSDSEELRMMRVYRAPVPDVHGVSYVNEADRLGITFMSVLWSQFVLSVTMSITDLLRDHADRREQGTLGTIQEQKELDSLELNYYQRLEPEQRGDFAKIWKTCFSGAKRVYGQSQDVRFARNRDNTVNKTARSGQISQLGDSKSSKHQRAGAADNGVSRDGGDDFRCSGPPLIGRVSTRNGRGDNGRMDLRLGGFQSGLVQSPYHDDVSESEHQDNQDVEADFEDEQDLETGSFIAGREPAQEGNQVRGYQVPERELANGDQLQLEREYDNALRFLRQGNNRNAYQGRYGREGGGFAFNPRSNISTSLDVEMKFKDMVRLIGTFQSNEGGETWSDFYMNFMQSMNEYSIRPAVWGRLLSASLRGTARTELCLMDSKDRIDFDKLVDKLDRVFDAEVERELARSALPKRVQHEDESIRQFANAISLLARRAYSRS